MAHPVVVRRAGPVGHGGTAGEGPPCRSSYGGGRVEATGGSGCPGVTGGCCRQPPWEAAEALSHTGGIASPPRAPFGPLHTHEPTGRSIDAPRRAAGGGPAAGGDGAGREVRPVPRRRAPRAGLRLGPLGTAAV